MSETVSTQEIAQKMLKLWEERGHARYVMEGPSGNLCALGALHVAMFGRARLTSAERPQRGPVVIELANLLPQDFKESYYEAHTPVQELYHFPESEVAANMLALYNDNRGYKAIRQLVEKAAIPAQEMIEVAI